jgi:hypothetical protein
MGLAAVATGKGGTSCKPDDLPTFRFTEKFTSRQAGKVYRKGFS